MQGQGQEQMQGQMQGQMQEKGQGQMQLKQVLNVAAGLMTGLQTMVRESNMQIVCLLAAKYGFSEEEALQHCGATEICERKEKSVRRVNVKSVKCYFTTNA